MSSTHFVLRSSKTLPLTRELAIAHRDMPASPTERTFDVKRRDSLKDKFQKGLLISCQWAKAKWKDTEVRMNGQHSSNALLELEKFPTGQHVHIDEYEALTEEGMALLFRQFDARNSSRSPLDCSHAYQGLFDDVRSIDEKKALVAIKGINRYHIYSGEQETLSGDEIGKMFFNRSYDKFIRFVDELLSGKCQELKHEHVIAAMYGTYLVSEDRAVEFWNDVRTAARETSAAAVLDGQLYKHWEEKDPKKKLKPMQLYGVCIRAWNCFLDGDEPKTPFVQPIKKPLPEIHSV